MSKLKHEDMEQDVLIEYSSRLLHFYQTNKAVVWGLGIAVILIIALVIFFFVNRSQKESEAQVLLGTAEEYLMNGEFERALYGDDAAFEPGFVQIADNYQRTSSGNLANYYAAVAFYELESHEEALDYIQRFDVPTGIMGVGPISFHAVILSELGRHEEAGDRFVEAAQWDLNESTTPYNLWEAAVAYETAGNYDLAVAQLDEIIEEYDNSPIFAEAQRLKGMLTARL